MLVLKQKENIKCCSAFFCLDPITEHPDDKLQVSYCIVLLMGATRESRPPTDARGTMRPPTRDARQVYGTAIGTSLKEEPRQ